MSCIGGVENSLGGQPAHQLAKGITYVDTRVPAKLGVERQGFDRDRNVQNDQLALIDVVLHKKWWDQRGSKTLSCGRQNGMQRIKRICLGHTQACALKLGIDSLGGQRTYRIGDHWHVFQRA